ncbi:unnamed protein product [Protopolystoma xenopodis]|uniref:Uncharacterized protein n=1 Tax=Protopolystoma xenopodis TaxID=117903 RepID=A0A448XHM9_9PLAT|nr:unnamed protein product [Protopolystoma xenopodis]
MWPPRPAPPPLSLTKWVVGTGSYSALSRVSQVADAGRSKRRNVHFWRRRIFLFLPCPGACKDGQLTERGNRIRQTQRPVEARQQLESRRRPPQRFLLCNGLDGRPTWALRMQSVGQVCQCICFLCTLCSLLCCPSTFSPFPSHHHPCTPQTQSTSLSPAWSPLVDWS